MRGIFFKISLLAIAIAFVVGVQRDTFVRRWMLPAESAAQTKLRIVLRSVDIEDATFEEAVAHLARQASVAIEIAPELTAGASEPIPRGSLHLREVTAEAALHTVFSLYGGKTPVRLIALTGPDRITIAPDLHAAGPLVARIYDVQWYFAEAPQLQSEWFSWTRQQWIESERKQMAQNIGRLVPPVHYPIRPATMNPVHNGAMVVGHHLIVLGSEADQRTVAAVLRAMQMEHPPAVQPLLP